MYKYIYLSGPISGHSIDERRKAFSEKEEELKALGYKVFNPTKNGLQAEASTHEHMHRDLSVLTSEEMPMTHIYMMEGWLHSAGCKLEFDVATAIGLSVIFEEANKPIIKFK
jgi:hypothetical protein